MSICDACNLPAVAYVRWGTAEAQQGRLCQGHIDEAWAGSHHAFVSGMWTQLPLDHPAVPASTGEA